MVRTNMHLSNYKFYPPDKRLQIGIRTGRYTASEWIWFLGGGCVVAYGRASTARAIEISNPTMPSAVSAEWGTNRVPVGSR